MTFPNRTPRCAPSRVVAVMFSLLIASLPAMAEEEAGRYSMAQVEDGILRLDTRTGQVSHCQVADTQWVCRSAADDRAALDDEIAELQEEKDALRARIAELEAVAEANDGRNLALPSDEELDEVIGFMERLMRRFYAFAESLRNEPGEDT